MPRRLLLALLFASLSALAVTQLEPQPLAALQKVKGKGKNKQKAPVPVAGEKEDESKTVLAFDPGSHTRPISAMGFNKDQSKLITVGWDYTIQIWSTKTGERLDILRLPAYGRDNGFDSNRWTEAMVSPDGAYVVVGGGPKLLFEDKEIPTRLLIVDVENKRLRKINLPANTKSPVTCVSFSTNGNRLAVGCGGTDKSVYILDNIHQILKSPPGTKVPLEPALVVKGMTQDPYALALSQSGNRLVVQERRGRVTSFDVNGKIAADWKKLGDFNHTGLNDALEWAPDESHFAYSWRKQDDYRIELRKADCTLQKSWPFRDLTPGLGITGRVATFRYLADNRLFISAQSLIKELGRGAVGVVLDPKTGKTTRHFSSVSTGTYQPHGAASTFGPLAATATSKGLEAVIYSLADGKVVARCGSSSPMPTMVGWAKDVKSQAIAWTDNASIKAWELKPAEMKYAFDLVTLEMQAKIDPNAFAVHHLELGEWKLGWTGNKIQANYTTVRVKQGDRESFSLSAATAMTLIPNGDQPPLFAHSMHDRETGMGSFADIRDATGKVLTDMLPLASHIRDMVPSPDGRYLLMSTGTHRLSIYRTNGSRFPFLNFVRVNGEWICWTPEGYFSASPGGEKMLGWSECKGANEFAVFHPAEKFAKQFRRPDVIKLALEKGSINEALDALKVEVPEVETILPPEANLEIIEQRGAVVKVKAFASSSDKSKPILAMRVLLDGRPFPNGQGVWEAIPGKPAEGTFELEIPGGLHELKVLARNENGTSGSEALRFKAPREASTQPVLHRICIGINDYDDNGLKLGSATKDATAIFEALEKFCVGPENRFGKTRGELILDKQANRQRLLTAFDSTRKAAKGGDLVVIFFAGHGIKQDKEFYIATHEADPSKPLKGISVSGDDLKKGLAGMECPVLMILDACHSAASVKSFRPATDDLTRTLTDDSVGVTVLSAAMSNETAGATSENGFFTAGLLKALEAGAGVPFDPYEQQLYVHHIYSVAYSEVRKATNGKQNPFLNSPWTASPIPIREVSLKR